MISTQPGPMPLASFKVLALEASVPHPCYSKGNDIGKSTKLLLYSQELKENEQFLSSFYMCSKELCCFGRILIPFCNIVKKDAIAKKILQIGPIAPKNKCCK